MGIELQVSSVTALVTSEPKEKNTYEGYGDNRKVKGRAIDAEGRMVSHFAAVVMAEPLGLLGEAMVQIPDIQVTGLVPGAIVRVEGQTIARLAGGDYGAIRAQVSGERLSPLGKYADWLAAHQPKPSDKPA